MRRVINLVELKPGVFGVGPNKVNTKFSSYQKKWLQNLKDLASDHINHVDKNGKEFKLKDKHNGKTLKNRYQGSYDYTETSGGREK